LTKLAPQLATGPVARGRPVAGLLVEAGIRGVAMPLSAAAVGGMVGAALWFKRRTDGPQRHRWRAPALYGLEFVVVLIVYGGLGLVDIAGLRQGVQLGLYLVITVVALLVLRVVLQAALLYEEHDDGCPDEPVLCMECEYVVPDMAFCAHCGMAPPRRRGHRGPRGAGHAPCASTQQPPDHERHHVLTLIRSRSFIDNDPESTGISRSAPEL
jgi:hypothetical protein